MLFRSGRSQLNKFASKIGFASFDKQEEEDYTEIKKSVMAEVEKAIKPEILGRINGKIVFRPLGKTVLSQIIHKELSSLQSHLLKSGRIIAFKDNVIDYVVANSSDKFEYGAREIKSLIASLVQDPIAEFLLDNPVCTNLEVKADENLKTLVVKEVVKKGRKPTIKKA